MCRVHDNVIMKKRGKEAVLVNRTEYKNQHAKEHYDRINLKIPKGEKAGIRAAASAIGMSVNEYLYALICTGIRGK